METQIQEILYNPRVNSTFSLYLVTLQKSFAQTQERTSIFALLLYRHLGCESQSAIARSHIACRFIVSTPTPEDMRRYPCIGIGDVCLFVNLLTYEPIFLAKYMNTEKSLFLFPSTKRLFTTQLLFIAPPWIQKAEILHKRFHDVTMDDLSSEAEPC